MYCRRVRKLRTKGALLVLLWNFLMQASVFSPLAFSFSSSYSYDNDLDDFFFSRNLLLVIALLLFLPIFGWLADVHFGRYKVMNAGIWIMWVCSVAGVVAKIVQYLFPETAYVM